MPPETSPAPGLRPTSRRHDPATIARARNMYEAGWTPTQIVRYLADQAGLEPAPTRTTVELWVKPGLRERYQMDRALRRGAPATHLQQGPALIPSQMYARMRQLREAGLAFSGIAVVMNLDHGLNLTPENARSILRGRRLTRTLARHLVPKAAS